MKHRRGRSRERVSQHAHILQGFLTARPVTGRAKHVHSLTGGPADPNERNAKTHHCL